MAALHELHRPLHLADVVGQAKAVTRIQRIAAASGLSGRAWWITGRSGTGKTTIARIIAAMVADDFFIQELDAQWLTPARIQEMEREMSYRAMGSKPGKSYIVNEAHTMKPAAIAQLLTTLDPLPEHVAFVFTTTLKGQSLFEADQLDASPLMSRCTRLELEHGEDTAKAFAELAMRRCPFADLPEEAYLQAAKAAACNMRALWNMVESGEIEDTWHRAEEARKTIRYLEQAQRSGVTLSKSDYSMMNRLREQLGMAS